MRRRDFLRGTLAASGAIQFGNWQKTIAAPLTRGRDPQTYDLDRSVYAGKSYTATVPDTLDLAERAELAINGMGGTIDPSLNYMMYFLVRYACNRPYMSHHCADSPCDPKFAESFPMMRIMSGTKRYAEVESGQRIALMSRIRDGLYWSLNDPKVPWRLACYGRRYDRIPKEVEDTAATYGNARMLRAMVTWRELSGDSIWDQPIRDHVRGMSKIAIKRDDYAYYPNGGYGDCYAYPRSGWLNTHEPEAEVDKACGEGTTIVYQGGMIQGLMHWYAMSGDSEALDLGARLTRFCMKPKFWGGIPRFKGPEDAWLPEHIAAEAPDPPGMAGNEYGHWYSHFHCRAVALRGMLEYARVVQDWRVLEFVRRAYDYSWNFGIRSIGWVNCWPATVNLCEGCALGDLVALGTRLSDAGLGDYWDDVDSLVRNHLMEQQLIRADLLEKVAEASPPRDPKEYSQYSTQEVHENVIQRSLGIFAGQSAPTSIPKPWVMQCCTGNATQGLYYGWEGIVRQSGDAAQVNLLLNRASPSLDIDSYLPYEGRVVLHNKNLSKVSVRVPFWVMRKQIRSTVSGNPRSGIWVGNYLTFDDLKPGDTIALEFPIKETTVRYTGAAGTKDEQTYTCTFRGSTLVDISPRDFSATSYPLYLRDHMRKDKAPLKQITRFVSERSIRTW